MLFRHRVREPHHLSNPIRGLSRENDKEMGLDSKCQVGSRKVRRRQKIPGACTYVCSAKMMMMEAQKGSAELFQV